MFLKLSHIKIGIAVIIISSFLCEILAQAEETTAFPEEEEAPTTIPDNVAEIVAAITDVQKNISVTGGKTPNVKVAGVKYTNDESKDNIHVPEFLQNLAELQNVLSESEDLEVAGEELVPSDVESNIPSDTLINDLKQESSLGAVDTHSNIDADTFDDEVTTVVETDSFLPTPEASFLSYSGAREWYDWVVNMRDPAVNPEGVAGWFTIMSRGLGGLMGYYNPFRRFMARALDTSKSENSLQEIYSNRRDAIETLMENDVDPDIESIKAFIRDMESLNSNTRTIVLTGPTDPKQGGLLTPIKNVTDQLQDVKDQFLDDLGPILDPLDIRPTGWDQFANYFPEPYSTVLKAPTYVKVVNFLLKSLYILIALSWIPFSGIENFFLAPIPPEIDSYPGFLRMFGLQAILGPEYMYDYNQYSDELLDGEIGADDDYLEPDYLGTDDAEYDYATRRIDQKVKPSKKRKTTKRKDTEKLNEKPEKPEKDHVYFYNDLSSKIKPPPSKYGLPYREPNPTTSTTSIPNPKTKKPSRYGEPATPDAQNGKVRIVPVSDYVRKGKPPRKVTSYATVARVSAEKPSDE